MASAASARRLHPNRTRIHTLLTDSTYSLSARQVLHLMLGRLGHRLAKRDAAAEGPLLRPLRYAAAPAAAAPAPAVGATTPPKKKKSKSLLLSSVPPAAGATAAAAPTAKAKGKGLGKGKGKGAKTAGAAPPG